MSIKKLPLSAIRIDADTQSRLAINEATVADYHEVLQRGDKLQPFDVFHDGKDYYVADGFHRFLAHKRHGTAIVDIEYHEGTVDDARWFSAGANIKHGLPRSAADKRCAVELALRVKPDASDRAIAEHCYVSPTFVGEVRRGQVSTVDTSNAEPSADKPRRKGLDGKTYPPPARKPPTEPTAPPVAMPDAVRYEASAAIANAKAEANGGTPLYKDCVGRDIPADMNAIWEGRDFLESLANDVYDVRVALENGDRDGDKALQRVGATVLASLQRCEGEIREAMPYALCPVCQGVGCKLCRHTGFLGKMVYDTAVPDKYKS